jgi:hypothetical protein
MGNTKNCILSLHCVYSKPNLLPIEKETHMRVIGGGVENDVKKNRYFRLDLSVML